jgi:hypothetical protein
LRTACFVVRKLSPGLNRDAIQSDYFALRYVILWGNSTNAKRVFLLQKGVIRIMKGVDSRCSSKGLRNQIYYLFIVFYLLMFVILNFNFLTNIAVDGVNTGTQHQLHRPAVTLSCIKRGVFYSSTKIFYRLPLQISALKNETPRFRVALRKHLITHVFCFVDEFFSCSH